MKASALRGAGSDETTRSGLRVGAVMQPAKAFPNPQVFVGETRDSEFLAQMGPHGWGRIWVERTPKPLPNEPWAFDNGAYACFLKGQPFDEHRFLTRLDRASMVEGPTLAVVPDIVGGGLLSLEFSLGWRMRLRDDWPWYLAVQDGMELDDVAGVLDGFDGIFLGGTTRFKSTAMLWCQMAHVAGKKFHYGRASVLSRVQQAKAIMADSLDSSFPLWTRGRFKEFMDTMLHPPRQGELAVGPGAMTPWKVAAPSNVGRADGNPRRASPSRREHPSGPAPDAGQAQ